MKGPNKEIDKILTYIAPALRQKEEMPGYCTPHGRQYEKANLLDEVLYSDIIFNNY